MPKLTSTIFRTSNGKLAECLSDMFDLNTVGNRLLQKREEQAATAIEIEVKQGSSKLKSNTAFWKIGFLMPDVNTHVDSIRAKHAKWVRVSKPAQFLDIGFLCHTKDTDGNSIEVLQHDFEENFKGPFDSNPVTLGQVTIRTAKLEDTLDFYQKRLGMKMLSVQPVKRYGFCLYFVGYTDDIPPNADDLEAVENREWLWKKPYCTIEIQHVQGEPELYEDLTDGECGWRGFRISMTEQEGKERNIPKTCMLRDPNNIPVYVDIEV